MACSVKKDEGSAAGTQSPVPDELTKPFVEKLDPALDKIIQPGALVEVLSEGFEWSEGPVWLPEQGFLIFSDIPPNKVFKWEEKSGLSLYLHPSGYTGEMPRSGEGGSNGLLLDEKGRLVLCQHGDRRLARMDAPLDDPKPAFITLADAWEGKRLNSPNDAVYRSNGELYFTDPPYGLVQGPEDPQKEIDFQGIYRLKKHGEVELLSQELSRPNGIAFSEDEQTLYVANSDENLPVLMAFDVGENGSLQNSRVFCDMSAHVNKEKGLPDGMVVHSSGTLFATGPGGVWILSPDGDLLGKIKTGVATANCTTGEGESMLYITAHMYLMRVPLVKGHSM
jgi:gluconolactonase